MLKMKQFLGVLFVAFCAAVVLGGCHKRRVAAPPTPPPPPPAAAAPTANLTAEPAAIEKGQSATLSWNTANATDIDIEPGVGKVEASGTKSVSPTESTTYVLTATGAGGTVTANARVTVTTPPPPAPSAGTTGQVSEEALFESQMKDAYFDLDKSDIRPDAAQALTADAEFLKAHPNVVFTIEGHCDERGSEEYNLGLGERRAQAAKNFLVNLGVSADRMFTISYGKDKPFCTEHTEECWQQNRRAHFKAGR